MFSSLDDVLATLDGLADVDFASEPEGSVAELVGEWCQVLSRVQAVGAPLLAAWDAQQGWAADGAVAAAPWLRAFGELEAPTRRMKVALRLRNHAPLTAAALASGELSYAKAATLMDYVADGLGDAYAECEQVIVAGAIQLPLRHVATLARRWRAAAVAVMDDDDRATLLRDSRQARIWETFDGQIAMDALFDTDTGVAVANVIAEREQQLLRADVSEVRAAEGLEPLGDDEEVVATTGLARTSAQRRADAIAELILLGADRDIDNQRLGGPASELHLTTDPDLLFEAAVERVHNANLVVPGLVPDGVDPVFVMSPLVQRLLDHPDTRCGIQDACERAIDRVTHPEHDAHLDDHDHPIDLGLLDLLACDCTLTRVLLDAVGIPIDVGRTQRLATREQRRALRNRDSGCAFPGCDRPPAWCDSHHIIPWILHGPTDIDNLVFLCRRHHHLMHQKVPWVVHIDPRTRRPVFTRPDGQPARQPGLPPPTTRAGPAPPDRPPGADPPRRPPDLIPVA